MRRLTSIFTSGGRRGRFCGPTIAAIQNKISVLCFAFVVTLAVLLGVPHAAASGQVVELAAGHVPSLAPLVREVTPAVVNISVQGKIREDNPLYKDPFFREFFDVPEKLEKEINAAGSGVIVDAQRGYVLTANHVVAQISRAQITTKDGRRFSASVIGRDSATDIAVLQIKDPIGLKAIPMGDSDLLEVGDFVIAVGNPFGLGQTVTSGLVSALGRTGLSKEGYEDFIQTDAPINPGNSGGGLINLEGDLIGINTAIISPGGGNVGIGFAVPVNMARAVMEQIVKTGHVQRGRIGVGVQELPADSRAQMGEGALIGEVMTGSPAEHAGIRKGDVVVKVDGISIRSATQLRNKVGLTPVGRVLRLTIERGNATQTIDVEVGAAQSAAKASLKKIQ
jgi:serine protease Do